MRRQERRDERTEDVVQEGFNCGETRRLGEYILSVSGVQKNINDGCTSMSMSMCRRARV